MNESDRENGGWRVVVNHEEQYSTWPVGRENPLGWRDAGKSGTRDECLAWIREVWTDMRPLSLRKAMDEAAPIPPPPEPAEEAHADDELVERLSRGEHRIEMSPSDADALRLSGEELERAWIILRFPDTRGATVLGFRPDTRRSDVGGADLDGGTVHIEGELTLDDVRVRCVADLDLPSLTGRGRLERVDTD